MRLSYPWNYCSQTHSITFIYFNIRLSCENWFYCRLSRPRINIQKMYICKVNLCLICWFTTNSQNIYNYFKVIIIADVDFFLIFNMSIMKEKYYTIRVFCKPWIKSEENCIRPYYKRCKIIKRTNSYQVILHFNIICSTLFFVAYAENVGSVNPVQIDKSLVWQILIIFLKKNYEMVSNWNNNNHLSFNRTIHSDKRAFSIVRKQASRSCARSTEPTGFQPQFYALRIETLGTSFGSFSCYGNGVVFIR